MLSCHTGALALENLGLKLSRLGSKIMLMGFIFPMGKESVGRFNKPASRQDRGQDASPAILGSGFLI